MVGARAFRRQQKKHQVDRLFVDSLIGDRGFQPGKQPDNMRETSEPAVTAKLRETQMMTLILGDAAEFKTFFAKQLDFWGKVVRDNNIRATG